ncbi:MAG: CPBP family intramembrane glutamic endopeptidase [Candidatus Dormibacteria bacterium]
MGGRIGATGSKGAYLGVIAIVPIAPVVEEITFRCFITGGLRSRTGVGWAVVPSSLGFILAHALLGGILFLGASLFVAGLARARHWTRSLHPGIVLHASFNLVAVILIFLTSTAGNCH